MEEPQPDKASAEAQSIKRRNLINLAIMLAAVIAAVLIYNWRKANDVKPQPLKVQSHH